MHCCGTSNKLHIQECEFLNKLDQNQEFLEMVQQCKNDVGLVDPDTLIKKMENSSNEHMRQNVDAVRKKLKNLLPSNQNEQKHVLEEVLLINTLKGGMQEAINRFKPSRNNIKN